MKTETDLKLPWQFISLALLVLVGTSMRLFRLTRWGFADDELFTLRDSLKADVFASPKPLLFFLNHYLVAPILELDELGLRLLPMVFGVAGIVAVFYLARRVLDHRSALFSALLVTFSPWHLYWSQNARYHTLVFLLSAAVPVALYVGVREKRLIWVAVAALSAVLAVLAHPSAAFVAAGCAVWLAGHFGLKIVRGRSHSTSLLAVGALLMVVFALASVFYLLPLLVMWNERGTSWGYAGPVLLMSYGNWVTVGVSLFAAGGLAWMWREGPRELAVLLALVVVVPMLALAVLGYLFSVSVAYLFSTTPFVMMAAGYFLARLTSLAGDIFRQSLVGATCALAIIAGGLPSILSHYLSGSRPDFKAAARHIEALARPGDVVLSDEKVPLEYYLSSHPVRGLRRDPIQLETHFQEVSRRNGRDLWIVAWMRERGGFNDQGLGPAMAWVWRHCVLNAVIRNPRLDYKRDDLNVYRCGNEASSATSVQE